MKSVFRTLLKVLLLVSLATTPIGVVLATVQAGNYLSVTNGEGMAPCPHVLQDKAPVAARKALSEKMSCTCHVGDCSSMDNSGCQHSTVLSLAVLLTVTLKFPAVANDHSGTVFQDRHTGLSVPPESPPPIL